jgi:hypothetical protein
MAILTIVFATDVPEDFGSSTQKLLRRGIAFYADYLLGKSKRSCSSLQDGQKLTILYGREDDKGYGQEYNQQKA